jgi:gas vesicle protein
MAKIKKRKMNMVKIKTTRRKSIHKHRPVVNHDMSPMVMGAAAGCLLGAAAALFLVPKPKRHRFTENLDHLYDQVTGTAGDYAHGAVEKSQRALKGARNAAGNIYGAASQAFNKTGKNINSNLLLGILGAGILGASAVYVLSQKETEEHKSFAKQWGVGKWTEIAKLVFDSVSNKLQGEEEEESSHGKSHNPVQNVLDWAMVGLDLWQEIKKRR